MMHYKFEDFVKDLGNLTKGKVNLDEVKVLLKNLIKNKDFLNKVPLNTKKDNYVRYLLHADKDNRFAIYSVVWDKEHGTLVHDHDSTWGVEIIVYGKLAVENFKLKSKVSNKVKLDKISEFMISNNGTAIVNDKFQIHRVKNAHNDKSISIHVYGKRLDNNKNYLETKDGYYEIVQNNLEVDN